MNSFHLAFSALDVSYNVLLVIFSFVCLLLCFVILLQRPKQEGLGAAFGGGMADQAFGAARTTDILQKATAFLGTSFFVLAFAMLLIVSKKDKAAPKMSQTPEASQNAEADQSLEKEINKALSTQDNKKKEVPSSQGPSQDPKQNQPAPKNQTSQQNSPSQ